ncbi:MAG: glutamate 5-kinase [Alphaproteobacteria bacterium]|nr:glutamate 5-kinase [Alphaproteobacteria bacterium]
MDIVIKIGTQALSRANGTPDPALLGRLMGEIAALKKAGHFVVLVTSGAVGTGRALLGSGQKLRNCDPVGGRQILAALGQPQLMALYQRLLKKRGLAAAQILLTRQDFHTRKHYQQIGHLFARLRDQPHILPVVNENDSVTIDELMFTDNDELAGLVAALLGAERMIVLSAIEGVFDRPPAEPGAKVIPLIDWRTGTGTGAVTQGKSAMGRGGMATKLAVARKLAGLGIRTQIAAARTPRVLARLAKNDPLGTMVAALPVKHNATKRWLASETSKATASVTANECLAVILRDPAKAPSLLPVGITRVSGKFARGEMVRVIDEAGTLLALGVARYDAARLRAVLGQKKQPVFIHYDQLHRTAAG